MGLLRIVLMVVGVLAIILGVWWICQGTGLVPIGFMANHMQWAYRGAVLVVVGVGLGVLARRI
jgi:hypothetical protein